MHSEMGPVRQKLYITTVHNTAQNSSDNLPSYIQTIIMSIAGEGEQGKTPCHRSFVSSQSQLLDHRKYDHERVFVRYSEARPMCTRGHGSAIAR